MSKNEEDWPRIRMEFLKELKDRKKPLRKTKTKKTQRKRKNPETQTLHSSFSDITTTAVPIVGREVTPDLDSDNNSGIATHLIADVEDQFTPPTTTPAVPVAGHQLTPPAVPVAGHQLTPPAVPVAGHQLTPPAVPVAGHQLTPYSDFHVNDGVSSEFLKTLIHQKQIEAYACLLTALLYKNNHFNEERTNLLNGFKKELKISEDEEIKVIDQIENDSNVNLIRELKSFDKYPPKRCNDSPSPTISQQIRKEFSVQGSEPENHGLDITNYYPAKALKIYRVSFIDSNYFIGNG
ncbi:uncharacterized protein LOC127125738 isoform X1 [Lathyrus oleraceus]|uniref:uncharacterized protein LOC127125738 isoform X1 n=1 Tax=Pisum sativum TaxID=3888 RepID=UPI0021D23005|nr:uncharacterized protein LOC127125738 isoform X1 [Pisum sativum]